MFDRCDTGSIECTRANKREKGVGRKCGGRSWQGTGVDSEGRCCPTYAVVSKHALRLKTIAFKLGLITPVRMSAGSQQGVVLGTPVTSQATVRELKLTCNRIQVSTSCCWAEQVFWPNDRNCTSVWAQKIMGSQNPKRWEISTRIMNNQENRKN